MKKTTIVELCECKLTNDELIAKGTELSKKNQEKSRLEADKKAITSEYSAKINACDAQIETISTAISTRSEMRRVECDIEFNKPVEGQKTIVRTDTNEPVRMEMMSDEERKDPTLNGMGDQEDLFVFKDKRGVPLIDTEAVEKKDAKTWETIGFPNAQEVVIEQPLDPDCDYRVLKGANPDGEGLLYQLQKKKVKGEKKSKAKKTPAESEE